MAGAILGRGGGELFAGFVEVVGEPAELLALGGGLGGLHGAALDGIEGGLLADAIALGGGVLRVELEQAGGKDAGFLLRVDDAQILFELRQGSGGALHLGPQLFDLLFHEGGKAGGGAKADVVGVLDVAVGDSVGDIRGQFRVRRPVADEQQVSVGRARDLELLEGDRSILRAGAGKLGFARQGGDLAGRELEALGDGAQDRIGLDDLDLGGQELIGVVGGEARGILADDAGGRLAVDIDGRGGFVDRREARRNYHGADHRDQGEGDNPPLVALEDPQIVGEGDGGFFGLGLGVGVRGVDRDRVGDRRDVAVAVTAVGRSGKRAKFFFVWHGVSSWRLQYLYVTQLVLVHCSVYERAGSGADAKPDDRLNRPHADALASVIGDVEDVVGDKRDVRGFAL